MHTGNRFWLVGQGMYDNELVNQTCGMIDEVRISDTALKPEQFLFSAKPATDPSQALPSDPVAEEGHTGGAKKEKK